MLAGVGLFVVLLALIGLAALSAHKQSVASRKASDQFVQALLSGDVDASYNLFSSQTRQNLSHGQWSDEIAQLSLFFTARKPVFSSLSVPAKGAVLAVYKIPGNDGQYTFSVHLTKQGGSWYVVYFSSTRQ